MVRIRGSMHMMKSMQLRASPCLTPLAILNPLQIVPFIIIGNDKIERFKFAVDDASLDISTGQVSKAEDEQLISKS